MPQFDLYRIGDTLIVDVQANLLDALATRVVVPLLPRDRAESVRDFNPVLTIDGSPMSC